MSEPITHVLVKATEDHTLCGMPVDGMPTVSYVGDATCQSCRRKHWPTPEQKAAAVASTISDYVNGYSNYDALAEEMLRDHPTLQQQTMRVIVEYLRGMAAKEYVDARNESSRDLARALVKTIDEDNGKGGRLGYLPFI